MVGREEEKRRRREERLAAEEARRRHEARMARLRSLAYAVLAVTLLVLASAFLLAKDENASDAPSTGPGGAGFVDAPAPPMRTEGLGEAVALAGCELREDRELPAEHTTEPVTYETNPPTSGPHDPVPADDGAYAPGNVPRLEPTVHALEHGRINIQWRPGTRAERIGQLKSVLDEQDGYHVLLYENQTDMPYAVAATAWTRALTCREITDRTFDAIRAFRARYTDQGPEFVP